MNTRLLACLLGLVLTLTAYADTTVIVETVDGSQVTGRLLQTEIAVATPQGEVKVAVSEILSIEFGEGLARIRKRDGSSLECKPATDSLRLSTEKLGNLDVKITSLRKVSFTPVPIEVLAKDASPTVEVLQQWRLGTCVLGGLAVPAEGKSFWIIDAAGRRAVRFDGESLKPAAELQLPDVPQKWSLAPGGRVGVIVTGKRFQLLDLRKGELSAEREFHEAPVDVLMFDDDTLLAIFSHQKGGELRAFSMTSFESVVRLIGPSGNMKRFKEDPRVYTIGGIMEFSRDDGNSLRVSWRPEGVSAEFPVQRLLDADRYLTPGNGIYRVSRSYLASAEKIGQLPAAHVQATLHLAGSGAWVTFHSDGVARVWDHATLVQRKEVPLGVRVYSALAFEESGCMLVFATSLQASSILAASSPSATPPGDLFRLQLPK